MQKSAVSQTEFVDLTVGLRFAVGAVEGKVVWRVSVWTEVQWSPQGKTSFLDQNFVWKVVLRDGRGFRGN
jgi:hypothetical protein